MYSKNRSRIACTVCRSRKTRCDGGRPKCSFCQINGCVCRYVSTHERSMESNVESILSKINIIEKHLGLVNHQNSFSDNYESLRLQSERSFSAFPLFTIKDSRFSAIVLGSNENISLHARLLEQKNPVIPSSEDSVAVFRYSASELVNLYFTHSHIWYPLLRKQDIIGEKLVYLRASMQNKSTETFLLLMVLAIGGINADDGVGAFQAEEFYKQAISMLSCVLEQSSLQSIQCLVLLCMYYGLNIMPVQAQEYISISCVKMQNLIERRVSEKSENTTQLKNYGLDEYEMRTFWTLFILESEYSGAFHFASTGLVSYANDMEFPSLIEEPHLGAVSPGIDSAVIRDNSDPHFLSEIGVRRIIDRTCYTFKEKSDSTSDKTASFAPIVAKELQAQLDNWYRCLPETIKFDKAHEPISGVEHSSRYFLRCQYFATSFLTYWPCILDIIVAGNVQSSEQYEALNLSTDLYIQFISSAVRVKLMELPLIWTHAVSIFAHTAVILRMMENTIIRTQNEGKLMELKKCVQLAFDFLESADSSKSIKYLVTLLRGLSTTSGSSGF